MLQVEKISQTSSELLIKWSDHSRQTLKACVLQRLCPCALCLSSAKGISPDVKIISYRVMGRLGIKIKFSSGCQKGLYTFDLLRSWLKANL